MKLLHSLSIFPNLTQEQWRRLAAASIYGRTVRIAIRASGHIAIQEHHRSRWTGELRWVLLDDRDRFNYPEERLDRWVLANQRYITPVRLRR